jgi:type IV pilus assembly protein PilV
MSVATPVLKMRRASGFTLIEVLVAMIVLAVGLLGLASLQATSLRFNSSAYLRSQATNIAYDMVDRMRANRQAALTGAYDGQAVANPAPACASVALAGATIAARDIQSWRTAMACALPQGTGSIARNNSTFTLVIQWDDSRGQEAAQQFTMVTDL